MRKSFLSCLFLLGITSSLWAQHLDFQSSPNINAASLYEKITRLEKKTDMFNLYLNMQGSFNIYFTDQNVDGTFFRMNQLRIEAKGNITDRIYYRYRQRLNESNNASNFLDNLPASLDYAAVGFHICDGFSAFFGKQPAAFGGFEYDLNPIEVYQYSDLLANMQNFLTGLDIAYSPVSGQEFRFQVVDSRSTSFKALYGDIPDGIKQAKTPLGYTLNWNGNMFDEKLKTRWSASVFHEAKKKNWYFFALGTELCLNRFLGFFDFMYSMEDMDRTGIITRMSEKDGYAMRALDARYLDLVLHLNYRVIPKLNVFAKGAYETARIEKNNGSFEKGKYLTAWLYVAGLEYYPMQDNLHIFLNYVGRTYDYTDRAKVFGLGDIQPQRVEFGLVYQLHLF